VSAALLVEPRGASARAPRLALDSDGAAIVKEERHTLIWKQPLPDGTPAFIKLYRHRPPSVTVPLGLERCRAEHEFDSLRYVERRGLPCSPPLFWARGRDRENGRFAVLATREVPDSTSLERALQASAEPCRALDLAALFRLVAWMHAIGVHHGMLETRNVLVRRGAAEDGFSLIDLPRSIVFDRDLRGTRAARFDLAVLVWGLAPFVDSARIASALTGYGMSESAARSLARRWLARRMSRRYRNLVRASLAVGRGLGALRPAPRARELNH
jgi:tRNA A-37 threonylcarbamoyl transferase component Bud32